MAVAQQAGRGVAARWAATPGLHDVASVGRLAIQALYREAALAPKPGLVSPDDAGSHDDMDFRTFVRSLAALRPHLSFFAAMGAAGAGFASLQRQGRSAEAHMLAATGGVNTHRGAIFNLGLLCAAAAWLGAQARPVDADSACAVVARRWGQDILRAGRQAGSSHGREMSRRHGSAGARGEAAAGFPAAREVGLPAYREALAQGADPDTAAVQALFALIARLDDTNLLWRGGPDGLRYARRQAAGFLDRGGVHAPGWRAHAQAVHARFVARRLSPGGSADLLGVTLFLDSL